jgi:hypothetical protein
MQSALYFPGQKQPNTLTREKTPPRTSSERNDPPLLHVREGSSQHTSRQKAHTNTTGKMRYKGSPFLQLPPGDEDLICADAARRSAPALPPHTCMCRCGGVGVTPTGNIASDRDVNSAGFHQKTTATCAGKGRWRCTHASGATREVCGQCSHLIHLGPGGVQVGKGDVIQATVPLQKLAGVVLWEIAHHRWVIPARANPCRAAR